jgi:glyoxylase-like metal-dependent hydrolase (beta-lactamase superfamily II)
MPDTRAGLERAFAEDDRGQLRGEPLCRQLVVSDDPTVPASYRSKDAIDFYLQPTPPGIWENSVTIRSTRAARMYDQFPLAEVAATEWFLTTEQSQTLLDWVVASGKNLTAIYVTHGHGDYFFGLASLLERFPRARAVATPEVVKAMHEHLSPAGSRTSGAGFSPARFQTACWLPNRSNTTIWSWRGTSLSR